MKVGSSSPWGAIQHITPIQEGIVFVETASHGGIKLDRKRNAMMPAYFRMEGGWYEEDCNWAMPALVFGFNNQQTAMKIIRDYFPDKYEEHFGCILHPGESYTKDERAFYEKHKDDYIVTSASGDWHDRCPKGMVLVIATKGTSLNAERAEFLITAEEYDSRSRFGFVIDLAKHQRVNP